MSNSVILFLMTIAGGVVTITFWCGTLAVIAYTGGWQSLAEHYRNDRNISPKTTFSMQSARLCRFTGYNNILRFGVADEGLTIQIPFPFKTAHPPLIIPWEDILAFEAKMFLVGRCVKLTFVKAPNIPVYIDTRLNKKLTDAAGGLWPRVVKTTE